MEEKQQKILKKNNTENFVLYESFFGLHLFSIKDNLTNFISNSFSNTLEQLTTLNTLIKLHSTLKYSQLKNTNKNFLKEYFKLNTPNFMVENFLKINAVHYLFVDESLMGYINYLNLDSGLNIRCRPIPFQLFRAIKINESKIFSALTDKEYNSITDKEYNTRRSNCMELIKNTEIENVGIKRDAMHKTLNKILQRRQTLKSKLATLNCQGKITEQFINKTENIVNSLNKEIKVCGEYETLKLKNNFEKTYNALQENEIKNKENVLRRIVGRRKSKNEVSFITKKRVDKIVKDKKKAKKVYQAIQKDCFIMP